MSLPQRSRFLLIAFLFTTVLFAQTTEIANQYVKNVVIKGNHTTSREFILTATGINPGSQITVPRLEMAVKKLYAMDVFTDIRVEVNDIPDGVQVIFNIEETP